MRFTIREHGHERSEIDKVSREIQGAVRGDRSVMVKLNRFGEFEWKGQWITHLQAVGMMPPVNITA